MAEKYESFETYLIKHLSEELPDLSQPVYAEVSKVFYQENVGGVLYQFEFEFPSIDDMPLKKGISGKDIPDFNKIAKDTIIKVQRVFPDGEVIVDFEFNVAGKGGDLEAYKMFSKSLTEGKGMKGVLLNYYDTFPVKSTLPTTLENDITIPDTPEGTDTPTNVVDDNYIKGSSNGPSRTDKILIETLEDFASYSKIPFSDSIEISKQNQQGVRMSKELGYTEDGFLYLYNSIDSTYQYVDPNDIKKLELFLQENDLIDFLYTNQLYVPFQIDVDKEILTKEEILKLPDIPVNHITEGVSIIRNLKEKYPDELIDLVVDFDNVDGGRINIQSLFIDSDIKEKEIYLDVANELNQLSNKYNVSINVYDDNPIHNFYNIIDQPKNIVDDVVVTSATENLKQTIPTNADGNIVLYRATTDPNVKVLSDFTDINKSNQAGLGKQNFYAIDEMYAYNYSRPSINKNVYKFETNIKPSEVLNLQTPTNQQLDVLEKIGITAEDLKKWDMPLSENSVNTKIQNNLDYLLENNIKAIGNNKFGGSPGVFDYEIVPIITEKTQTKVKPVSQLILDPNWEGTDRILNVENELFQSTQSTQWADKYLPIDVNDPNTKYRPVYYVDEEGIGRKAKDFQFSKQPIENNLVKDNLIEVPVDTNTNVELVKDKYVLNTDTPGGSLGAAKLNDPLVFDSWVDNYAKTTTSFVDNLPLSTTVKNQFNNLVQGRARNLATPGGLADAVDVWELSVLGLMISAVAYKEYDEIPTILTNKAVDMFNNMTSFYGIPPIPKEEYDLDYERINKIVETGEKFMPTDIIIKKVGDVAKGAAETGAVTGFGYVPPNLTKTDTMETTQKIQPGVQEEKMFKEAKPKKIKSTGGSGAKIL